MREIKGVSERAQANIASLKHTAVDIEYVPDNLNTPAQWIYLPDPSLPEHRYLVWSNFCPGARGYWKETRHERSQPPTPSTIRFTMDYAYPLNTIGKNEKMKALLAELKPQGDSRPPLDSLPKNARCGRTQINRPRVFTRV